MDIGSHERTVLTALSPRDIAGWLRNRGYEHRGNFGEFGLVFARDRPEETQEVILPTSPQAKDFGRRMEELVNEIAGYEDRAPGDVLTDLTLTPFEVVRVRSPDADDYGSVRLSKGLDLHEEARNLVLSAANAAASPAPRRSWRGRRFEEVSSYLENVRLGQSQRGSFILTVLSPWDFVPDTHGALDLGEVTFGRRVTKSLQMALEATARGIRDSTAGGVEPLVNAYTRGVSSNFCQSLAKLVRDGEGIDVTIGWSPAHPESAPVKVSFKREDAAVLTEAAKILSRQEPEPGVVLEGLVAAIAEDPERFDGEVVLETVLAGALRRVRVKFESEERDAVYAAAQNKQWIRVVGDLRRDGRGLSLAAPRELALIHASEFE